MKRLLFVVLVLSLTACSTLQPQRKKAYLAIDSEPAALPERPAADASTTDSSDSSDEAASDKEIDLGFEGSTGRVRVEHYLSEEEEEAALADDSDDEEDADEDEDEESEEEEDE